MNEDIEVRLRCLALAIEAVEVTHSTRPLECIAEEFLAFAAPLSAESSRDCDNDTLIHDIGWAVWVMRQGMKVKRQNGASYAIDDTGQIVALDASRGPVGLSQAAILATDWELAQ